jgi:uracil phosphoribosyltransferase
MNEKLILGAKDIEGVLTDRDTEFLDTLQGMYAEVTKVFPELDEGMYDDSFQNVEQGYKELGNAMKEFLSQEERIKVFGFNAPTPLLGEASRVIAKLRDVHTRSPEFVYYIQRAFELLFTLAFGNAGGRDKHGILVRTPVDYPFTNFAVHRIPTLDPGVNSTVMCVMLRGALLPSMIVSKEIQEYSADGVVTPFALFKISRDDTKNEDNMEYLLDLQRSYFDLDSLQDKDLVFADPMNATGGSMVTIIKYLESQGVKPRSIKVLNVISALKGALTVVRAVDNLEVYTLWMDPVLNEKAYILPGLGDAGDRLNGEDQEGQPRNILQLIADYGTNIVDLYREQVRNIEKTILG